MSKCWKPDYVTKRKADLWRHLLLPKAYYNKKSRDFREELSFLDAKQMLPLLRQHRSEIISILSIAVESNKKNHAYFVHFYWCLIVSDDRKNVFLFFFFLLHSFIYPITFHVPLPSLTLLPVSVAHSLYRHTITHNCTQLHTITHVNVSLQQIIRIRWFLKLS